MLTLLAVAVIGIAAAAAFILTAYRRRWQWTGLPAVSGDDRSGASPRPAKSLWDWLQLLIVPLVLALAAFGLNAAQVERDRQRDERRASQERRAEQRTAARDRASAEDRAREETLAAYLQQMSDIMTRGGTATADTQTLARTLTLVTLRRLDGVRKGLVVKFLSEADLIGKQDSIDPAPSQSGDGSGRTVPSVRSCGERGKPSCRRIGVSVSLAGADLRGAVMPSIVGEGVEAFAVGAGTRPVESGPSFDHADLRDADFHGQTLPLVTFYAADLRGANFVDAELVWTSFASACLSGARFDGVTVVGNADFSGTEGRDVGFTRAQLGRSTFADARLTDVRLAGASTGGVRWPRGWTSTGLRMTDAETRRLCADLRP